MKKRSFHSIPALVVAVLFAVGILAGRKLSLQPEVALTIAVTMLAFAIALVVLSKHHASLLPFSTITLASVICLLGVTKIQSDISSMPHVVIEPNRIVEVIGTIIEPPSRIDNRTRFTLKAESITGASGAHDVSTNILVTVVRRKKDSTEVSFLYGSKLALKGQLAVPSAERNPGEFDARKYYEAQGVAFIMRVRGYTNVAIIDSATTGNAVAWLMKRVVVPVRSYTLSLIDRTVGGEEGELLKGIYIGERSGISYATRTAFTNSGISHILAVSGSNVVVVLVFFTMVFSLLRFPRRMIIVATMIAVVFYMLLTGSQPPIVRATVMTLVFLIGKLFGEKTNGLNSLGLSALLILGYDARQLFDVGFQLSFAAVASLIYLFPIAKEWLPRIDTTLWWKKALAHAVELSIATLVATAGTLPLIAVYFGKVSVVGLLTNIFIVPAVGASVILGFISTLCGWFSPFVADAFAAPNQVVLSLSLWVAKWTGGLAWAYVDTLQFRAIHSIPFYAALGVICHLQAMRIARKFFIGFLASLNLLVLAPTPSFHQSVEGKLRVSFLDIGQGDAALIEFPGGKTMLIDAGPASEEYDSGERIVAPFLKRRGITTIDYLVASHPHADHIGGFPHIFREFNVKKVIESGQPARDPIYIAYARAVKREECTVDTARARHLGLCIGDAKLYMLYPTPTFLDSDTTHPHHNLNNTSVVFKLCFGEASILFTGDAEKEAEEQMVRMYGDVLHSSILKAGHHGSITSSSREFLNVVQPMYAIISVGVNNKFNHPSEEILRRLAAMNVETLRTDEEGAIIFETDGKHFERIEWR